MITLHEVLAYSLGEPTSAGGAIDDMSDSCDSDTSEAIVMEIRMQQAPIPEGDVQQAVHTPVLEQLDAVKKRKIVVASGWTESYGRWWQEQSNGSGGTILFGAQLIGDARTPKEFTIMSFSDLACCRC